jgi:hypothetical protein
MELNWQLPRKRAFALDTVILVILTAALIWPLFRLNYLDNWASIESTFIADARILSAHLPHPGWQPLWYCGTRFDYIYPPALRYGTALISKLGGISTARAYHLYTATYYVFGIAAVYWLAVIGTASRRSALISAAAAALLSPSFLFMKSFRIDSGYWIPQRLHVLTTYGEGPHISALCVLPAALAACLLALRKWRPAAFVAAAALCALTVANNFYGATALAILFPLMAWSVWIGERDPRVWLRALAIAALAYGFSAFWLTPSYVRITLLNLKWVAHPGNGNSLFIGITVAALFCAVSFRLGNRMPARAWTIFVAGAAIFLTVDVAGFYFFGFRIAGEPLRLIPEMDLAIILAAAEALRALKKWGIPVILFLALAFYPAVSYLRHAWSPFPESPPVESRYEFEIARWVHDHLPGERVLPPGSVRFWFDAWDDNAQQAGGSDQGMLNQMLPAANWQISHGNRADLAILWLQALGTDAVIVPDAHSLEYYHDYEFPEKFRGAAPMLFDDGHGTVIYRVPRLYRGIGRIVDAKALEGMGTIVGGDNADQLTRYVAIVEKPDQPPTTVTWRETDEADIETTAGNGQAILLQETFDPAWRAYERGQQLPIRPDPAIGFMTIPVTPGVHKIKMRFEVPLENRVGQVVLGLSLIISAAMVSEGVLTRARRTWRA